MSGRRAYAERVTPSPVRLWRSERDALCDLLLEKGPDAPTLCGDWTTRDLAAHLHIRENRPDAAVGIVIGPLARWTAKVQADTAAGDYAELVEAVRTGPPRWSPVAIEAVDVETNTIEFFVHHEDVRRATEPWEPRSLGDEEVAQLWGRASKAGTYLLRRSPVGVLATPSDGPAAGTTVTLRKGSHAVDLRGPVGEIVLAMYGRVTKGLEIVGTDADVHAFRAYPR